MAKKKAKAKRKTVKKKAKRKTKKKVARKPVAKKKAAPKKKQPGKRNHYAHIPKDILAAMERAPLHTNGFDITDKQSMFVEHLLCAAKWNATQAAKLAGYSVKSAGTIGPGLLRNPRVQKYLRKRIDDRRRRLEISQDKIVQEMTALALAKPSEFLSLKDGILTVKDLDDIPLSIQGAMKSFKPIFGKKGDSLGIEIRFYDKVAAAKLLAQHLGMLGDKAKEDTKGIIIEAMEQLHAEAGKLDKGKA